MRTMIQPCWSTSLRLRGASKGGAVRGHDAVGQCLRRGRGREDGGSALASDKDDADNLGGQARNGDGEVRKPPEPEGTAAVFAVALLGDDEGRAQRPHDRLERGAYRVEASSGRTSRLERGWIGGGEGEDVLVDERGVVCDDHNGLRAQQQAARHVRQPAEQ